MSRRARRLDGPKSAAVAAPLPTPVPEAASTPLVAIALGNLRDGRHVAMELHLRGGAVVGGAVLCAAPYAATAARAWSQCAYLRLGCGAEYGELEQAANERDGKGVEVAQLDFAVAVAMPQQGRRFGAVTMEINGGAATEPKVLCVADRLTAWSTLASWAAQHLLPRRR